MLLGGLLVSLAVLADEGDRSPIGQRIVEVRVEGVEPGAEHVVMGQVKTRPGQVYNPEAIPEDVRNIYSLGRFDSVEPRVEVTDQGVVLIFSVRQRVQIADVEFQGARSIKASKLQGAAGLSIGDYMDPAKIALARQEILKLYKDEGYFFAEVTVDEQARVRGRLVLLIREGPKVRIDRVLFVGNDTVAEAELNGVIETARYRWLISAGTLDEARVKEDVVLLLRHYRDEGYLDVRVDY